MRASLVLAVVVATLPLAGCGGSSSPAAAPTPTVTSPAPTPTAPANPAAATAEVKANWAAFFDGSRAVAQRAALVEDGAQLTQAMALGARDPNAKKTRSLVTAVTFTSAVQAAVTYDLYVSGAKVLTGAQGQAVLAQGHWKVSKFTFCQLLKLGANGSPVPGCV